MDFIHTRIPLIIVIIFGFLQGYNCKDSTDERLKRLEERFQRQENLLMQQNRRINSIEKALLTERYTNNEMRVKLSTTVETMYNMIDVLNVKLERLLQEIATQTDKNEEKDMPNDNQSKEKAGLENVAIKRRSVSLERENRLLLTATNPPSTISTRPIAFYAYMSKEEANPSTHHPLVFDVVKVNIGGAYNSYSGSFIVPVDGVYVMSFSIRVYCHAQATIEIVKNSESEGIIYADASLACDNDTSSKTVVINAVRGDIIFVRTHSTHSASGSLQSNSWGHTSFCGWLLG